MIPKGMALLFRINQDKTTVLTVALFKPCFEYISKQVEELYQLNLKELKEDDKYCGLLINSTTCYRPVDKLASDHSNRWIHLDSNLSQYGDSLENFIFKVRKDVRIIQMWLSTVIDTLDPVKTKANLLASLAKLDPVYNSINVEHTIPEGKEDVWAMIKEKVDYYLGLSLVL